MLSIDVLWELRTFVQLVGQRGRTLHWTVSSLP
jgi:hypothetical protein